MIVIEDLQTASCDVSSLQDYLSANFEKVYDFFTYQRHSDLVASKEKLKLYIHENRLVILQLDITIKTNLAFISLLLDISEELGLLSPFSFLYEYLQEKEFNISERLKAAALYLIDVHTANDYINRYEKIYNYLQSSADTEEEDNTDKVLMTMVNFYAQVVHNFGEFSIETVLTLKAKIEKSISLFEFSFLNTKLIYDVLDVDLDDFNNAYLKIHTLLDSFLGRDIIKPTYRTEFLIETESEYCNLLKDVTNDFSAIRQISVQKYRPILSNEIFNSLGRGVAVLTEENQLFAYMYSFGDMHYKKLMGAFQGLPKQFFNQEINIIDWGCGQAMATMTYFDYLNQNEIKQTIKNEYNGPY